MSFASAGTIPFHHVFREREIDVGPCGGMRPVWPAVRYAEPGVMVCAFPRREDLWRRRCAGQCRVASPVGARFHDEMPRHVSGAGFMFWVFHVIRDYARTLAEGNSRMTAACRLSSRWPTSWKRRSSAAADHLRHNDLLPANSSTTARGSG
jgi:hypothetical protein